MAGSPPRDETLVTDKEGSTVFLSDGIKRDFEDVEFYYEEWCYKQVKAREHDKDVQRTHGLLVGRDYGSLLGLGGLESFAPASGLDATDDGGKGGASGLFAPGSFLAEFAQGAAGGGFGFGDDIKGGDIKGDLKSEHKDGDKKGDQAKQPIGDGKAYGGGGGDKAGDEHKDDGVKKRGFSWFRRVVIARE
ncbi:hypothetical protein JCM10450v2_001390 [Rhodotorula kratochvilovae]